MPQFLESDYIDISASGRANFLQQDFFDVQATKEADVYFLRHVIHNWPDLEAVKILSHLAAAMAPPSKVLICEHIVLPTYASPEEDQDKKTLTAPEPLLANWGASFTSRLDLQVLAVVNARQRTVAGFKDLLNQSGLRLERVWRNMGDETILECHLA